MLTIEDILIIFSTVLASSTVTYASIRYYKLNGKVDRFDFVTCCVMWGITFRLIELSVSIPK